MGVWPTTPPTAHERAAYADAEPRPFWLADLAPPEPAPALIGTAEADLCIVGGGFTGLWAALHAKADDPGARRRRARERRPAASVRAAGTAASPSRR